MIDETKTFDERMAEIDAVIADNEAYLRRTAQPRIDMIKAYALLHYNDKGMGWDFVVETMSDDDIYSYIKGTYTDMGAKRRMSRYARQMGGYRADVIGAGM